jgi:hypothetical protein
MHDISAFNDAYEVSVLAMATASAAATNQTTINHKIFE